MITINLPIKLVSSNTAEHWSSRSKRNRILKVLVKSEWNKLTQKPTLPCTIIITRIAPRPFDQADNYRSACKGLIDRIAETLIPGLAPGRADADPRLHFEFRQEKGKPKEYMVRIDFEDDSPSVI